MAILDWVCDVCGAPATSAARDAVEVPPAERVGVKWGRYRPGDKLKRGCNAHPAKSYKIKRKGAK